MTTRTQSIHVVTIFPDAFRGFLSSSLLGKAREKGLVEVTLVDIRDFTSGRHRSTDDSPYGGGAGMVMLVEPIVRAVESVAVERRVLLTPQGSPLRQRDLVRLSEFGSLALLCGRYEGFDERVRSFVDEELSLGDYVVNGGEVAAMVLIDGIVRLLPGVVGNPESLSQESHADRLLEYPHYTRPVEFRGLRVPEVLLSGDHQAIARWRRRQSLRRTKARRPDIWAQITLDREDLRLLEDDE
jgi:tRNA (guanine37-N1)-methyltransferase